MTTHETTRLAYLLGQARSLASALECLAPSSIPQILRLLDLVVADLAEEGGEHAE